MWGANPYPHQERRNRMKEIKHILVDRNMLGDAVQIMLHDFNEYDFVIVRKESIYKDHETYPEEAYKVEAYKDGEIE